MRKGLRALHKEPRAWQRMPCRGGGWTCWTPRRWTSRSRTSHTAWPGWRGGTGRRWASTPSRSPSTRWWSRRSRAHLRPELEPRWRLAALLHDASEYVIGDMISPFKAALGMDYRKIRGAAGDGDPCPLRHPGQDAGRHQGLDEAGGSGLRLLRATQLAGFEATEALEISAPRPRLRPDHRPAGAGPGAIATFSATMSFRRRRDSQPAPGRGFRHRVAPMTLIICGLAEAPGLIATRAPSHMITLLDEAPAWARPSRPCPRSGT